MTVTRLLLGLAVVAGAAATMASGATHAAPGANTGGASNISATSATVACTIAPNRSATSWYVEYGTSTGYGSRTGTRSAGSGSANVDVSVTLNGLQNGRTYHYRCVATSSGGTARGVDASFATRGAPAVVTGAATEVTVNAATVSGTVNPNGGDTTWWVEYGTSAAYGSKTNPQSAGAGTTTIGVGLQLVSLAPGTVYHYRFVAQSATGTTRGSDATFQTTGPPSATTGIVPFSSIAPGKATVLGTVNPRGEATSVWFEYGRTKAFGARTGTLQLPAGTADTPVQVSLTGLQPGVRYWFRIVASSSAGTTEGAPKSFSTPRAVTAAGRQCTIVGSQGADVLRGTPGRDVICGLGGDDRIYGLGGNDVLIGGPGNDIVSGGPGNDVLQGGLGVDSLLGGTGQDQISGGSGNDSISARDGRRDVVVGGPGADKASLDRGDRTISIERKRY